MRSPDLQKTHHRDLNLFIISIIDLFKVANKTYKSYAPFKVATINKHTNERQKKMKRTGHSNI